MLAFTAARLLAPCEVIEHPLLLIEQGRILRVASRADSQLPAGVPTLDFGDNIIAPGYLDLHIHGSAGFDVMDETPEALPAIERLLARHEIGRAHV